jgi:amidase
MSRSNDVREMDEQRQPADDELCLMSISALSELLRTRQVSAVEVTNAHLDRIHRLNPLINALVTITPELAVRQAREADAALIRGEDIGILHGIPTGFKDTHDTAGIRTTYGSPIYADHVPDTDDVVVARMRQAGAITLGKTNVPEFETGANTFNSLFGPTRNPYDLSRTSGGSSGGSAAALATGMISATEGSDLGGSLRNPAAFCNIVGLRPTAGRVPDTPSAFNRQGLLVRGPMGRTVDDVATTLAVIAGHDTDDPAARSVDGRWPHTAVPAADLRGLRVAWAPDLGGTLDVDDDVLAVLERQLPVLQDLGCIIEPATIDLDGADDAFRTLRAWMFAYTLANEYRHHRDQLKPSLVWNIEEGRYLSGRDIAAALDTQTQLHQRAQQFFRDFDLLLLPATQTAPWDIDLEYPMVIGNEGAATYLDCLHAGYAITMTGCPALSIPAGFTREHLPIGLQMVGPHRGERRLLSIAKAFEEATGYGYQSPALATARPAGALFEPPVR